MKQTLNRLIASLAIGLTYVYKYTLSMFIGRSCRFLPTCSDYMIDAIRVHGGVRGIQLGLKRIGRCRPGGGSGLDPVPEPEDTEMQQKD